MKASFTKIRLLILLSTILLLSTNLAYSQSQTNLQLPETNPFNEWLTTDFCEVIRKAYVFDGKVVRIRAKLHMNHHGGTLGPYDSNRCGAGMRMRLECSNDADCEELSRRLGQSLVKRGISGHGALVVVGRFKQRKLLTYRDLRLGLHEYEFHVSRIVEVLKLPEPPDAKRPQ
jgi:hypothetical protein